MEIKRPAPIKAILKYITAKYKQDTLKDNYVMDALWLLATDRRASKLKRYSELINAQAVGRRGQKADDIVDNILKRL